MTMGLKPKASLLTEGTMDAVWSKSLMVTARPVTINSTREKGGSCCFKPV